MLKRWNFLKTGFYEGIKDLRRWIILAPTARELERRYGILPLAQGWTASATAGALERDPHHRMMGVGLFGEDQGTIDRDNDIRLTPGSPTEEMVSIKSSETTFATQHTLI